MKKKWRFRHRTVFSRDTCWGPTRQHYVSKPGGGEGGGEGLGGRTQGPGPPPPTREKAAILKLNFTTHLAFSAVPEEGFKKGTHHTSGKKPLRAGGKIKSGQEAALKFQSLFLLFLDVLKPR